MSHRSHRDNIELRASADELDKDYILFCSLRIPAFFADARRLVKSDYLGFVSDNGRFSKEGPQLRLAANARRVLWQAILDVSASNCDQLPTVGLTTALRLAVERVLEQEASLASDDEKIPSVDIKEKIFGDGGWLALAETFPVFNDNYARDCLAIIVEDGVFNEQLRRVYDTFRIDGETPKELGKYLEDAADVVKSVRTVNADPIQSAFPDEWDVQNTQVIPTNVEFLDEMMDGGQAAGEVYLVLGPSGVGKTTLGVQLAVQGAGYQVEQHPDPDDKDIGHWFYFTYEAPVRNELMFRVWSYSAVIHRDSLWKMKEKSSLSTATTMREYEKLRFADAMKRGAAPLGEVERLTNARTKLKRNLWLVDMSGADPTNPKVGSGGIEEMASYLNRKAQSGMKIAGFVVDYAGLAVDRYMAANKAEADLKRWYLSRFCYDCSRLIASPLNASGWILHQLSGVANSRSPTYRPSHTDAADCKTMADNTWFAFNLGTKDKDSSMCQITCSKTRRAAGDAKERVIFIDGAYCAMSSASADYSLDPRTKRIVKTTELNKVHGAPPKRSGMSATSIAKGVSAVS